MRDKSTYNITQFDGFTRNVNMSTMQWSVDEKQVVVF